MTDPKSQSAVQREQVENEVMEAFPFGGSGPGELRKALVSARLRLREVEQERDKTMRALVSLTPSGSEVVDDAERCVAFVRDSRDSHHRAMVNWAKQAHAAESRLAQAGKLAEAARRVACDHKNRSGGNDYLECNDCGLGWDYRRTNAHTYARLALRTALSDFDKL